MSIAESFEHVKKVKGEATIKHKRAPRQRSMSDNRRILRATMEKYWVCESIGAYSVVYYCTVLS